MQHKRGPDLREWIESPYTKRTARELREDVESSRLAFHAACRATSDPRVAATFAILTSYESFLDYTTRAPGAERAEDER